MATPTKISYRPRRGTTWSSLHLHVDEVAHPDDADDVEDETEGDHHPADDEVTNGARYPPFVHAMTARRQLVEGTDPPREHTFRSRCLDLTTESLTSRRSCRRSSRTSARLPPTRRLIRMAMTVQWKSRLCIRWATTSSDSSRGRPMRLSNRARFISLPMVPPIPGRRRRRPGEGNIRPRGCLPASEWNSGSTA